MEYSRRKGATDTEQARGLSRAFSHLRRHNLAWALQSGGMLLLPAVVGAVVVSVPLVYVIVKGLQGGWQRWLKLLDVRVPALLTSTLTLTLTVTVLSILLGTTLAWLVHRSNLPGRKYWSWMLALPLLMPPYVGAVSYVALLGPKGWIPSFLGRPLFHIYSFTGVTFVLTLFTYPYVFMIVGAALKRASRSFEETARALGHSPWQVFWRVTLPLLRPAIGAGGMLTALYVMADFGAVSMLRYTTFTSAIYYQMGSFDPASAAILSLVLIGITMLSLWLEGRSRTRLRFYQIKGEMRRSDVVELGMAKAPAMLYVAGVFAVAVLLPVGVLLYWAGAGIRAGEPDGRFIRYVLNSTYMAGLAAVLSLLFAVPISWLKARRPSRLTWLVDRLAHTGYVLPGVIVALGIVFMFNNLLPGLYGTAAVLVLAYVIRFLPQNLQAVDTGFAALSPHLEEIAQSLGYTPLQTLRRVTLPLITPSALTGAALVFVSSLKELPATLLLRPAGLDTLTVRIWIEASEGFYQAAAPAVLLLIVLSIVPFRWMLGKY